MSKDEVAAARVAIEEGDFARARHHMNNIAATGPHRQEIAELEHLIRVKETDSIVLSAQRVEYAVGVCVLGYIILGFRTPNAWGGPVWGLLGFLVLPLFTGLLAGNSVRRSASNPEKSTRFWRGFTITAVTMAIYTLVSLNLIRHKMQSSDKASDFFIYFVVMAVYAVGAGVVAGISGIILPVKRSVS